MVSFTTKSGERVSFKTGRKKKKSGMSAAKRKSLSRAAKSRPRTKSGRFKKKR